MNEKMLSLTVEMWDCGGRAVSPFLTQFKYFNERLILIDNIVQDFFNILVVTYSRLLGLM